MIRSLWLCHCISTRRPPRSSAMCRPRQRMPKRRPADGDRARASAARAWSMGVDRMVHRRRRRRMSAGLRCRRSHRGDAGDAVGTFHALSAWVARRRRHKAGTACGGMEAAEEGIAVPRARASASTARSCTGCAAYSSRSAIGPPRGRRSVDPNGDRSRARTGRRRAGAQGTREPARPAAVTDNRTDMHRRRSPPATGGFLLSPFPDVV